MKCYNHPNYDASAVCRSCGRALCRDCVVEVGLSCSCKDRCESVVETLNYMVDRGRTVYKTTSAVHFRHAVFVSFVGAIMAAIGLLIVSSGVDGSAWGYLLLLFATPFLGLAVSHFIAARRFTEK